MSGLTHDRLRELLKYDPETGQFTWLVSTAEFVGKIAGFPKRDRAYWLIQIGPKRYRAHRLAWFYMTGEWPKDLIDHRDGDGLNNRWANLREADSSKNTQNSRRRSDNRSGLKGVNFVARLNKWKSRVSLNGKRIYLGSFATPEAAHAAYAAKAIELHGEFARAA